MTGNIDDQSTCGELVDKYCNDPYIKDITLSNTVENPYLGNLIHNEEVCGELATFYCGNPDYLGYYLRMMSMVKLHLVHILIILLNIV